MGLRRILAIYTGAWLALYAPGETFYTISLLGLRGVLHPAFAMSVIGMALLCAGAVTVWRERPYGPGLLAAAWSWMAATMWRAAADRFWYVSLGRELPGGDVELWLGPVVTALAVAPMVGSLLLLLRQHSSK